MSTGETYSTQYTTVNAETMAEVHPGVVSTTEWYAPSSYAFNDPYISSYPTSTVKSQPWPAFRTSIPDISLSTNFAAQPQFSSMQHMKNLDRPRSSPSTFGPGPDNITWPINGLGIFSSGPSGQPTPPVTSTFPPAVFQNYPTDEAYSMSSPPEIRQPKPTRPYTTIAPNPSGTPGRKRGRDDDSDVDITSTGKRRKRTSSVASADLSDDDRFLVQLKEDENLPWKDIAGRFHSDKGKNFQVAALQMRYKRLREKFRVWDEQDVSALKSAHEYWEKYKWEIIGAKMLDFGIGERWPARHCARKWQEMETTSATSAAMGLTPGATYAANYSSPVDSGTHFAFLPMQ